MLAALLGAVCLVLVAVGVGGMALQWTQAAALVAGGVAAVLAVRVLVLDVVFLRTQGHRAPALVHVVVSLVLYVALGLFVAGAVFDQSLTGALATSAVASVVLGLALQETLGNLFAGIALQVQPPFRLGDVVRADGFEGRVVAFNWRATTVATVDDSRVVIPNATVAGETVEVFGRADVTRRRLVVPAPYDAAPQEVAAVVRGAVVGVPGVAEAPAAQVRLASFDDSSVGYEVLYWVADALAVAATDAVVRERVWYAFARRGLSIPFPHEVQVPYERPARPAGGDPAADRARSLGRVALFAPLAPPERRRLAEEARTCLYGPGETILRAGDEGDSLFVVLRGRIEVRLPRDDGRRVRVAEMAAGEVIGEMSLLTGEPRSADVRAVGEVELLEVRRADVKGLLAENEALAEALAGVVSDRVAQRADALALVPDDGGGAEGAVPLLRRIKLFFELA